MEEFFQAILQTFWGRAAAYTVLTPIVIIVAGSIIEFIQNEIIAILTKGIGSKAALFIANYFTFIGTIHHELSHALFVLITGAKIGKIELFHPHDGMLGSVEYAPRGNIIFRSIQNTMAAIAPMVLGAVSEFLLYRLWVTKLTETWQFIVTGYVMLSILLHMTMSNEDIKQCLKGLPICLLIEFIGICVYLKLA